MFVRFRRVRHRLVLDLVASKRAGGKIVTEHIARLGSAALPEPISSAERILFWNALRDRWRKLAGPLSNRVSPEDRKKALAAIHARIPRPTPAEEQAVLIEAMENIIAGNEQDISFFSCMVEGDEAFVRQYAAMIANCQERIADCQKGIASNRAVVEEAERKTANVKALRELLAAGQRADGDEGLLLRHVTRLAAKRDAQIRAAPRKKKDGGGRLRK